MAVLGDEMIVGFPYGFQRPVVKGLFGLWLAVITGGRNMGLSDKTLRRCHSMVSGWGHIEIHILLYVFVFSVGHVELRKSCRNRFGPSA